MTAPDRPSLCPECGEVSTREIDAAAFFAVLERDIRCPLDEIERTICERLDHEHRLACCARKP